ncbi:MAG TPA: chromate transporter, partial [Geobacteraceae bacterium]|nr:chromate transporter [Geobacteraceae bacterium]
MAIDNKKPEHKDANRLVELMLLFSKLGTIGFGGPAAHIAMMEEETVGRRKWLTREHFLDLVGATNLIPGPNSTEMAIHVGYVRAGLWGLLVAGVSFILPAVVITAVFAWMYVKFGTTPAAEPFLFGIKPAVISIIATAVVRLGRTVAKSTWAVLIGIAVAAASLAGLNEVIALIAGGIAGLVFSLFKRSGPIGKTGWLTLPAGSIWGLFNRSDAVAALAVAAAHGTPAPLWKLGLFFLKVGS